MKKSIAFFFLLVFSFSLPGYSVELHFCKGEITDVALFGNTACRCDSNTEKVQAPEQEHKSDCHKHCHQKSVSEKKAATKIDLKKCCKTEKLTLTSAKLKALSSLKSGKPIVLIAAAILNPYAVSALITPAVEHNTPYIPPLFRRDLSILNRVLII